MRVVVVVLTVVSFAVLSAQAPAPRVVPGAQAQALVAQLTQGSGAILNNVPLALRGDFSSAIGWLQVARIPDQVPAALVRSLKVDIDFLSSPASTSKARELAAEDVILKGRLCREQRDRGLGATVRVSVRTLLEAAESKGWEVVFKTAPEMEDPKIPATPFPGFSSPTIDDLPAARYVFWTRDPKDASRQGQTREVPVTATVSVDLMAPR